MTSYVLIIERDLDVRRSMAELFHNEGYEVIEESESGDGVARVMQRVPGVVIMADDMPSLDAVELLPLLRRLTRSPIIVVGEGGETSIVRALLQGADMYLRKPVNYRELLSRVRALFRRTDPEPEGGFNSSGFSPTSGGESTPTVPGEPHLRDRDTSLLRRASEDGPGSTGYGRGRASRSGVAARLLSAITDSWRRAWSFTAQQLRLARDI